MTREELQAVIVTSPHRNGRNAQWRQVHNIEEYLHIGGPAMTGPEAARRLGVTVRTVERLRAVLRKTTP